MTTPRLYLPEIDLDGSPDLTRYVVVVSRRSASWQCVTRPRNRARARERALRLWFDAARHGYTVALVAEETWELWSLDESLRVPDRSQVAHYREAVRHGMAGVAV